MMHSQLLAVKGRRPVADGTSNLIAGFLENHTALLNGLKTASRDFRCR